MQGLNQVKNRVSVNCRSVFGMNGGHELGIILASASIHCLKGVTNGGAIQHDPWPVARSGSARCLAYRLIPRSKTYVELSS